MLDRPSGRAVPIIWEQGLFAYVQESLTDYELDATALTLSSADPFLLGFRSDEVATTISSNWLAGASLVSNPLASKQQRSSRIPVISRRARHRGTPTDNKKGRKRGGRTLTSGYVSVGPGLLISMERGRAPLWTLSQQYVVHIFLDMHGHRTACTRSIINLVR